MSWCGLLADEVTGQQLLSLGALRKELLENPHTKAAYLGVDLEATPND